MGGDVLSNYVVQVINLILRLILIPIYINKLGMASFGLISFYYTIESFMVFFDFGMGAASGKLIAENQNHSNKKKLQVIFSIEKIYLIISIVIGIGLFLNAGIIAKYWLDKSGNNQFATNTVKCMGILLLVSWPKSFYDNILIGRKKFIHKNYAYLFFNILRTVLLVTLLHYLQPSIWIYMWVMIITVLFETITFRILAFRDMEYIFEFADKDSLNSFFKFSSGLGVFSILSLFLFQADRIWVSYIFNNSQMGIYFVCLTLPMAMFSLIYPLSSAALPRLVFYKDGEFKGFDHWIVFMGIIAVSYVSMLNININLISNMWLGENASNINTKIVLYCSLGVFFHSFSALFGNFMIANGFSKKLANIYSFSIIVYLLCLLILGKYSIEFISLSWAIANFSIFLYHLIFYYHNYSITFKKISYLSGICFVLVILMISVFSLLSINLWIKFFLSGSLVVLLCGFVFRNYIYTYIPEFIKIKIRRS